MPLERGECIAVFGVVRLFTRTPTNHGEELRPESLRIGSHGAAVCPSGLRTGCESCAQGVLELLTGRNDALCDFGKCSSLSGSWCSLP